MADTALTIITDALLDIGVLADEETPSASQAVGGLRKLNNMLESWSLDGLMVYGATANLLPMVSNKATYTLGPGGDLNIPRPDMIQSAYVRDTNLPAANRLDYPLYIYNNQEWQDVAFKSQQGAWPNWGVWFNYTNPLITAYVNPVPTSAQYTLVIWTVDALANLELNTTIQFPPGYARAITAALCVELAPSYGVQVPDTIQFIAASAVDSIKKQNYQLNELHLQVGSGFYDITTNRYWG